MRTACVFALLNSVAAGPCDIYAAGGTPCVAAHSVTRALYSAYDGALYAVRRASDNATAAIGVRAAGGAADADAQDAFCGGGGGGCTIAAIFDQSPRGNHLTVAPARHGYVDLEVNATREPLSLGGRRVYGALFEQAPLAGAPKEVGVGYRRDNTSGVATGDEPESLYMVTSGTRFNDACCFDYGNAETHIGDDGAGTMEAISWTNGTWGMSHHGAGRGPWVMADLEDGLFGSDARGPSPEPPVVGAAYVTAMVKGDRANHWAVKGGDANDAAGLKTLYEGARPCTQPNITDCEHAPNYNPMRKQGAIILGIGGDNSHGAIGSFYEGAITAGFSSNETDAAVHADIVAAGYGS